MSLFGDSTQYDAASNMASDAQAKYGTLGKQLGQEDDYLRRIARGQDSVSAMQLRQALGKNLSQQRSMAASASPQNATMAALMASRNAMQASSGLAGQQALAGIQERQAAQQSLYNALLQRRQQEQQAALQARQLAMQNQPASPWDTFGGAVKGATTLTTMV